LQDFGFGQLYNILKLFDKEAIDDYIKNVTDYKDEIKKAIGTVCKRSRRPSLYKILCTGKDGKTQPVWKAFKNL